MSIINAFAFGTFNTDLTYKKYHSGEFIHKHEYILPLKLW